MDSIPGFLGEKPNAVPTELSGLCDVGAVKLFVR